MGGKGSGGRRSGSGRPKKTDAERLVAGNASKVAMRVLTYPSAPVAPAVVAPVDEFDAPDDLTTDERNVWLELAPHAFTAGTLTRASSLSFRVLCRNVVLERQYCQSFNDRGTANHRGMIQRVEGGLDAFQLRPQGRRMPQAEAPEKPVSKLSKFMSRA